MGVTVRRVAWALLLGAGLMSAGCGGMTIEEIVEEVIGGVGAGNDRVLPELIAPADGAELTDARPVFRWRLPHGQGRVLVQICGDAPCGDVLHTFLGLHGSAEAPAELASGTYFWRAAVLRGPHLRWTGTWRFVIRRPCPAPPVVTADLHGVYAVATNDVWAVGRSGTILHYDGCWRVETSGTTVDLRGVWAAGGGVAFAVGAGGTILRRDGGTWSADVAPTTDDVWAVWGASASDAWAVARNKILHWDGATWTVSHEQPPDNAFRAVWGAAANDVWVGGSGHEPDGDYAALAVHWDGTSWTLSYLCNPEGTRFASGGWAASIVDLWGVGERTWGVGSCQPGASFIPTAYLIGESGGVWTAGPSIPESLAAYHQVHTVWASSATNIWTASRFEIIDSTVPTMLHYDGVSWAAWPDATTVGIYDLGGTAANDIWAVGLGGKRLHFDGVAWTRSP